MRRREFIAGLGSAALWPLVVQAQQPVIPIVGFLNSQSAQNYQRQLAAFLDGLAEASWQGDPDLVRLAIAASCVKYAWLLPGNLSRAADPTQRAYHQQVDAEHLFQQRGLALPCWSTGATRP